MPWRTAKASSTKAKVDPKGLEKALTNSPLEFFIKPPIPGSPRALLSKLSLKKPFGGGTSALPTNEEGRNH